MLVRTALFYDRAVYKMKKLRYPCHLKRESEKNLAIQFDLYTLSFNSAKLYHYQYKEYRFIQQSL